MKYLQTIYHFLGSIYFAIILIATVATFTIAGTVIESKTDSHQYAAYFTYENPFFILLLWCFFINILVSALRRWPFKVKHIPFLTTHAGLLMIFAGALIKSYFGVQGSMTIIEGGANDKIFEKGTYVIQVQPKDSNLTHDLELKQNFLGKFQLSNHELNPHLEVVAYSPHSYERLHTWIKKDQGYILGLKPFPVHEWNAQAPSELPISAQSDPWDILAFRTSQLPELINVAYLQGTQLRLTNRLTEEVVYQGLLSDILKQPILLNGQEIKAKLLLDFSPLHGLQDSKLTMEINSEEHIDIPLTGPESLLNVYRGKSYLGHYPLAVDLERPPTLLLIEDEYEDIFLFAFDPNGRVHSQIFQHNALNPIIVYDKGFGGYTVQAEIPFGNKTSRQELETSQKNLLLAQLTRGLKKNPQLAPPLTYLQQACIASNQDFIECCSSFLEYWNRQPSWLYPTNLPLPKNLEKTFNYLSLPTKEQNACHWISQVFQEIDPQLKQGKPLENILRDIKWPIKTQPNTDSASQLTLLSQQIFEVSELLPGPDQTNLTPSSKAHLLPAYLRAHGIHWSTITSPPTNETKSLQLESPITPIRKPSPPTKKLEDNSPLVTFKARKDQKAGLFTLTYDPHGSNFRWPILNGEYLVRFQPKFKQIPYKIRLRNARQINYPNSLQPYSYESDLIITDSRTKSSIEKTISMNNVHETWDGYRFYLANISPSNETAVKHIQIVVNQDPAKYWLTYPGALILTFGIILLFWMRPYK